MAEIGIDLSKHRSKHLEEFLSQDVETVITVCGKANQHCPDFPGQATRLHLPFDDPADATGSDEEQLGTFRRVRDEIIETLRPFSEERLAKAEAKLKIVSTATSSAAT